MKEEKENHLFAEFPEVSTAKWEEKIEADLKGADYRKKLIGTIDKGFEVKPYYRSEDIEPLDYLNSVRRLKSEGRAPNGWSICQDIIPGSNLDETNSRIRAALIGGATAIRICLNDSSAGGSELISTALEGIALEETEIHFRGSLSADAIYEELCEFASGTGIDPALLKGSIGADPLGKMASTGIPIASMENLVRLVNKAQESTPGMKVIDINGTLIQDAGSTQVEELAIAMAMANEYAVLLTNQGVDPKKMADSLLLNLASGPDYFLEIAKLRAARLLWGKIVEQYGIDPTEGRIRIHSTSSRWNMTLYDPHVNMLRGTTEAMSAILGGADLLSVLPFDYPYKNGNSFSDRISRNVQNILMEEAYFDRVADPASGSYYIESLTDSIGEQAWNLFRVIESKGGFRKTFESGWIQEMIMASRKKKSDRAASGKGRILGTNAFPDFNELILENLEFSPDENREEAPLTAIRPFRLASGFEKVRLETERSEKKPAVYLFKYGNPAWMSSRATFAGNFFACAGYKILNVPAFGTVNEGIKAARSSSPDIIVLCSSDDIYPEMAPEVLRAFGERTIIVVAGYPTESIEQLKEFGIRHFIHMKSNLLETLEEFNRILL